MSDTLDAVAVDRALKDRHRKVWASGDYPAVATEVIAALGPELVAVTGIGPGDRVLDVGAGSGNASLPAARVGASVVASDLTPELLRVGQAEAYRAGLDLEWDVADAEALPYATASFDAVISCVGVMFAPHHQAAADELVRVCRPGGRIGLVAWTPEGFIGQMFTRMRPFAPAPPAGVQAPPLWGDLGHVSDLLGDRVTDVVAERRRLTVERFATPEEFRDFFKQRYGPTIAVYAALAGDPDRTAALDRELTELGRLHLTPGQNRMEWEYLLLTARRTA